eukprot:CAMPEP_0170535886 /NCGR_PEP_ID=MMETSP0209-20121228/101843_1 /TAXON_ID=665100 ORGANISM="Litonotus pictus, Strain P1" /NCGR_SAMPLE_ID=MMETSP0209 /ASSEMBLY_ACC=CAM_ASM_000301 /LENGTH=562 /DNA_ID=CAMNT_0010837195 /DNA_START=571 /DNA_END=2259 /DNA_ORIENTATION=+
MKHKSNSIESPKAGLGLKDRNIAKQSFSSTADEEKNVLLKHIDPAKVLNDHEKLSVQMEDWFRIASPDFIDISKFPNIYSKEYKQRNVKVGVNNFRINDFYTGKKPGLKNYPPSRYHFFFRYSDKNIYYSNHPDSLSVLESFSIRAIEKIELNEDEDYSDCILISTKKRKWNICNKDMKTRFNWFCNLQKDRGVEIAKCHNMIIDNVEPTIIETKITQPIVLIPMATSDCNKKWDYNNLGVDWECDCSEGKEQSPIDLPEQGKETIASPVKPVFFYKTVKSTLEHGSEDNYYQKGDQVKFTYTNGYLSIRHPDLGNAVTLDGVVYRAEEVRFHTPAEHTINGKTFDMEIEIIHYGQTKGALGKQLVLNILGERYPGVYNKFIDDLDFFNLPNPLNQTKYIHNNLHLNKLFYKSEEGDSFYNLKDYDFYTYQGSLSSPPCFENTIHIVKAQPIQVGSTVLTLFQEAIRFPDTRDKEGNVFLNKEKKWSNRKTQPLNGRKVYYYKAKESTQFGVPNILGEERKEGHYEKLINRYKSYYRVEGNKPSGLPGSFVVPEKEAKGLSR